MTAHAILSPSAASRWLECTAAPMLEAQYDDKPTEYAKEGTDAHFLAEIETMYAVGDINDDEYAERHEYFVSTSNWYNAEMQEAAEDYASFIKELLLDYEIDCRDTIHELEVKVDLRGIVPNGFGTADCILISDDVLHVIDFKYGKGVKVEAEGNPQMKLYAIGAYQLYGDLYDIKTVKMSIVQPRLGGISTSIVQLQDLIDWGLDFVSPRAEAAYQGNGIFSPSEATCKFCKAAHECRARAEMYVDLFDNNPYDEVISLQEASKILVKAKGMKDWLKDLEERVFNALMDGEELPDWKLVEGRSNRKYSDEDALAKKLRSRGYKVGQIYEKKLLGITKMEKLVGKQKLMDIAGDLIIKPEGSPVLAEISDKREAINIKENVVNAFDE